MDTNEQEIRRIEAVNAQREACNVLFDALGPQHPGTIKARYMLAQMLLDDDPEDTEAAQIICEMMAMDEDARSIIFEDPFFEDFYVNVAKVLYNQNTDEADRQLVELLEAMLSAPIWPQMFRMPNKEIEQYTDLTNMLVDAYLLKDDYDAAFAVIEDYLSKMMFILKPESSEMMEAYETLGDIYSESGEDPEPYAELMDTMIASIFERAQTMLDTISEEMDEEEGDASDVAVDSLPDLYTMLVAVIRYSLVVMGLDDDLATEERLEMTMNALDTLERVLKSFEEIAQAFENLVNAIQESDDEELAGLEEELFGDEDGEDHVGTALRLSRIMTDDLEKVRSECKDGDYLVALDILDECFPI